MPDPKNPAPTERPRRPLDESDDDVQEDPGAPGSQIARDEEPVEPNEPG
jgi:hypothetical protein